MSFLTKFVDRVFAVVGAVTFLQAPQFIQSYTLSLSGHLAEVSWQLDQMRQMTQKSGRTLSELVSKFLASSDPDIHFQGELIQGLINRETSFASALHSLSKANAFTRPFEFATHFHGDIAKDTFHHFTLGLPLTVESLVWGVAGLFAGYLFFRGLAYLYDRVRAPFVAN